MAKQVKYTKEFILKESYKLLKEKGYEELTARNIAKYIKASPVPIYSTFESLDNLKKEILQFAKNELLNSIKRVKDENLIIKIGVGIVKFAGEEKKVFSSLFFEQKLYLEMLGDFNASLLEYSTTDLALKTLTEKEKMWLFHKCFVYVNGVAALVNTGFLKFEKDEELTNSLKEILDVFRKNLEEVSVKNDRT